MLSHQISKKLPPFSIKNDVVLTNMETSNLFKIVIKSVKLPLYKHNTLFLLLCNGIMVSSVSQALPRASSLTLIKVAC